MKELLNIGLGELTRIRLLCRNGRGQCHGAIEVDLRELSAPIVNGAKCPACNMPLVRTRNDGTNSLALLRTAITDLLADSRDVDVEFVLPAPKTG